jgi:hypothetical protein
VAALRMTPAEFTQMIDQDPKREKFFRRRNTAPSS